MGSRVETVHDSDLVFFEKVWVQLVGKALNIVKQSERYGTLQENKLHNYTLNTPKYTLKNARALENLSYLTITVT